MNDSVPTPPSTGSGRMLVLLGAIIVQLILGTVYGYSIFWTPLQAEIDLDASYIKYAFSICILSFAVTMVIAGRVQDVKGPRFPAVVGAILMGGGFLVAGLMDHPIVFTLAHAAFTGAVAIVLLMLFYALFGKVDTDQMPALKYAPLGIIAAVITAGVTLGNQYVGQNGEWDKLFLVWGTVGFLAGAGIGFAYVCPIAALVKWFPDHKGLVSGIAVAGFGFGAYLFKGQLGARGFIAEYGINNFFVVHGLVCLVGVSIGALMLRNPATVKQAKVVSADSNWQDTLKSPSFYVLWLMYFSGARAGLMVIGIVAPFFKAQAAKGGLTLEQAGEIGATAMGLLAIFNAIGRIAWGLLSDRIGRTAAFVASFVLQAGVLFVLGGLEGKLVIYAAASLIGFNYGGIFALFPSATADLFGAKNLGANYGWLFTSYGIAGVVGIAAGNFAYAKTESYTAAFVFAAVLCLVSAALAVGLGLARKRSVA